jgi:hypothetical protein
VENTIGHTALKVALHVRTMSAELLPLNNSFITFDLLFKIGLAQIENNELTLKALFMDLPHSEMGMRYHFRRLLANGWIEVHPSPCDRRSKRVFATDKLLDRLRLLDKGFFKAVEQHMKNLDGASSERAN